MKTLRQISDEQPVLYAQRALEANNAGKLLIVDNNDQLQLADYPEKTDEEKAALFRTVSRAAALRAIPTTVAPFAFKVNATASPIPEEAPVTIKKSVLLKLGTTVPPLIEPIRRSSNYETPDKTMPQYRYCLRQHK